MANLELYQIKEKKRSLDARILNMIRKFEEKTQLEVVGVYIERMDTSQMSSARSSILSAVEVQAMLEPVIETKPSGGGAEE